MPQQQWLGKGNNPLKYMETIDVPRSEGYQIREQVIFPTLFALVDEVTGNTGTPLFDVGSGTGSLTARLSNRLDRLVEGADISRRFVDLAKDHHPQQRFYRIGHKLPVGYGLHYAHLHLVLHCTPKPDKLLEDIADATEPNGYVFVTIPHPDHYKRSVLVPAGEKEGAYIVSVGSAKMTYYHRHIETHERLFAQAGLQIVAKRACYAPASAPKTLDKYKQEAGFIVYALQKKVDVVDTGLVMHSGTGKILLLTRALDDDKFPGVKSLFSVRRAHPDEHGPENLARGLNRRLGMAPDYIAPRKLGSLLVKHKHASTTQYADVNLYAVKISGNVPTISNKYYATSELIPKSALRPFGGACTRLGYEFLRSHA